MPFTLAHPAAAVPLRRVLGRQAVLSALVIGSMTPDFWYVLPLPLKRGDTHSLGALFWFCLPAGLLVYTVYHTLLKRPWLELFPDPLAMRLAGCGAADARLPAASWLAVVVSLAVGALTHLAWDALTHDGIFIERAVPALDAPLFSIGPYQAHAYSLLQHFSTLAGLGLLAIWTRDWFRRAPPGVAAERRFSRTAAVAVLCAMALVIGCIGVSALAIAWQQRPGLVEARDLARTAFARSAGAAMLTLVAYAIAWHALALVKVGRGKRANRS